MKLPKYFFILLLLLITLVPLGDLSHPGLPITHDGQDHVARIANFYQNLREGNIIPRWAGNLNWGYGHPILMFLYPLSSYTASLFHFFGFSLVDSTKIVFAVAFVASGLTMYLWIRSIADEKAAFLAGILYTIAPYRFVDLYVRGAIGEHVAFVFPPLILYFIVKLSKRISYRYIALGSISLAALILSHNAISLLFLPIIILYAFYLIFATKKKKLLAISYLLLAIIGFSLSAFFWIPAFFEGKYTLRDIVIAGEYASRFVRFDQLLYGKWDYGGSGNFTVQVGIAQWLGVISSVVTGFIVKKRYVRIAILSLLGMFTLSLFLMTEMSAPVWKVFTTLQKFQFPWRFLSVTVFATAVLGGLVVSSIKDNRLKTIFIIVVVALALLQNKDYWYANGFLQKSEHFYSGIYDSTTDTGESSPIWSVRFMEKRPKASMEVISGSTTIEKLSRISARHEYIVNAKEESRIRENTLYFPGWDVFVDGKKVAVEFQDQRNRGLMTFFIDKGSHKVHIAFSETKLRLFADIISLVSLVFLVALGILRRGAWQHFR